MIGQILGGYFAGYGLDRVAAEVHGCKSVSVHAILWRELGEIDREERRGKEVHRCSEYGP